MLDIEEFGRIESSNEPSARASGSVVGTTNGNDDTPHRLDRNNPKTARDKIAIQAIDRLGRIYRPLESAVTAGEVRVVLRQMRETYTPPLSLSQGAILLTCRYYLWRLRRNS